MKEEHKHNLNVVGSVEQKGELLWEALKCECGKWAYRVYNEERFLALTVKGCHSMRMNENV